MDFGAAFSFVTKDEDWIRKIAIASALALVGIFLGLGFIPLGGWLVAISRRVINGEEPELADFSEFGKLIKDGLKVLVVALVWALPLVLIAGCFSAVGALAEGQMQGDTAGTAAAILSACTAILTIPYGILLGLLIPAAIGQLATGDPLGQVVNPANAFKLVRANPGGYVIAWLLGGIISSVLTFVGSLLCVVGVFPAMAYSTGVIGHLYGQAYKGAQAG